MFTLIVVLSILTVVGLVVYWIHRDNRRGRWNNDYYSDSSLETLVLLDLATHHHDSNHSSFFDIFDGDGGGGGFDDGSWD